VEQHEGLMDNVLCVGGRMPGLVSLLIDHHLRRARFVPATLRPGSRFSASLHPSSQFRLNTRRSAVSHLFLTLLDA
jgi:hypothetical protein